MPSSGSLRDVQDLQEAGHGEGFDYRGGSPHLKHWRLYDRLVSLLCDEVQITSQKDLPLTLLEVGAGHGGYTEPALAAGCTVTGTELSRPSLARLERRFGLNPNFSAVFDPDGSLTVIGDLKYSIVLCASVLHHIPDYVRFLEESVLQHLRDGGALISIQDPLWYAGMKRADLALSKLGYFSWRASKGNYLEGAQTRIRRLRGVYEEANPLDMVEYHVVRKGVNQDLILTALESRFESVSMMTYWSTQSTFYQRLGELVGSVNSFAIVARGYRG
ncbi:MAG: class I SAM-dependent methyltransferase [Actinobacteria bacterium]|nr:class I SAM-dependent methyltransferase [Actinomycetota bacterium]